MSTAPSAVAMSPPLTAAGFAAANSANTTRLILIALITFLIVVVVVFFFTFGSLAPVANAIARKSRVAASRVKVALDTAIDTAGDGLIEIIEFYRAYLVAVAPILNAVTRQLAGIMTVFGRSAIESAHQFSIIVQISIDSVLRPIDAFFKYTLPGLIEVFKVAFETIYKVVVNIYEAFNPNNCGSLTETFTTL